MDLCTADPFNCLMDAYSELAYDNLDWIVDDTKQSENEFVTGWSKMVNDRFPQISPDDIVALYDRANDKHNSNIRTRMLWKYGTAMGVNGTPTAFVNGVAVDDTPQTANAWNTFFEELLANGSKSFMQ